MQRGYLELWTRPRYIVVIEGVLCRVDPVVKERRFRGSVVTGYNASWYDVPIKRLLYLKGHHSAVNRHGTLVRKALQKMNLLLVKKALRGTGQNADHTDSP